MNTKERKFAVKEYHKYIVKKTINIILTIIFMTLMMVGSCHWWWYKTTNDLLHYIGVLIILVIPSCCLSVAASIDFNKTMYENTTKYVERKINIMRSMKK